MKSGQKSQLVRMDDELFKALEVKSASEYTSREAYVRGLIAAAVGKASRIKPQRANIWSQVRRRGKNWRTAAK